MGAEHSPGQHPLSQRVRVPVFRELVVLGGGGGEGGGTRRSLFQGHLQRALLLPPRAPQKRGPRCGQTSVLASSQLQMWHSANINYTFPGSTEQTQCGDGQGQTRWAGTTTLSLAQKSHFWLPAGVRTHEEHLVHHDGPEKPSCGERSQSLGVSPSVDTAKRSRTGATPACISASILLTTTRTIQGYQVRAPGRDWGVKIVSHTLVSLQVTSSTQLG